MTHKFLLNKLNINACCFLRINNNSNLKVSIQNYCPNIVTGAKRDRVEMFVYDLYSIAPVCIGS
jgi:hypothetical protein